MVRLSVTLQKVRHESLRVLVLCDSVVGLDVEETLEIEVTGDEEQMKNRLKEVMEKEVEDDVLNADEFDDADVVFDEYLMDYLVCEQTDC